MVCFAALAMTAVALSAPAATLKPMTLLDGPNVRLADLFDDTGAGGARVLGPAPPPGAHIVVEAAQLAAIARQFGVDWQPQSGAERAVLERRGEPVPREAVIGAVRAGLVSGGVDTNSELETTSFLSPMIPSGATPALSIAQLDCDRTSGRFTALVLIGAEGMETATLRVSGRAWPTVTMPVAAKRLQAGDAIRDGDIAMARIRLPGAHDDLLRDPAQAVGLTVRRTVAPGQPIPAAALYRPPVIAQHAVVMVELSSEGMELTAQGQALEPGAVGDRIRVLNPVSRAVIEADVLGPNRTRAAPGSAPVVPAGRGPYPVTP